MDHVRAVEVLDGGAFADEEFVVEAADLGELVVHPFVSADAVVVASFDHERPRRDESGHLRVVEGPAHVPLPNFVFVCVDVAHRHIAADALAHPLIEVAAANAQAVVFEHRGRAHG